MAPAGDRRHRVERIWVDSAVSGDPGKTAGEGTEETRRQGRKTRRRTPKGVPTAIGGSSGSCAWFDVFRVAVRRRQFVAFSLETLKVESERLMYRLLDFFASCAGRDTTQDIGRIRRIAGLGFFDDDEVFHRSSPACLRILFKVPAARSSPGFPAIVTKPAFPGCLNCRWLPRVLTRTQPSSVISLRTSLTFTTWIIDWRRELRKHTIARRRSRPQSAPSRTQEHRPGRSLLTRAVVSMQRNRCANGPSSTIPTGPREPSVCLQPFATPSMDAKSLFQ